MFNVLYIHLASLPYIDLGPEFWKKKFSRFVNIDFIVIHNAPEHYANLVHISRITNSDIWYKVPKIVLSIESTNIYDHPENWHFFEENIDLFNTPQENCGHIKLEPDLHFINDFNDSKNHTQWKDEFSRIHSDRHVNYLILKLSSIINLYSDIVEIHDDTLHWPHAQKSFSIIINWHKNELTILERFYVQEKNNHYSVSSMAELAQLIDRLDEDFEGDLKRIHIHLKNVNSQDLSEELKTVHQRISDAKYPLILDWIGHGGDDQ